MIDWYAEQSDKFIGTAAAIASAIAAGVGGGAAIYSANKQSSTAQNAAQIQADASKYAADQETAASKAAEAWARQQAEQQWQAQQQTQQANYNQWKVRQTALANLGAGLGLNITIPEYVAGVDPHFDTGATPLPSTQTAPTAGSTAPGSTPSGSLSDPAAWMSLVNDTPKLSQWVQSQGITDPGLINYYVGKIKGQPGANPTEQAGSANYWSQKIKSDPSLGGARTPAPAATLGSAMGLSVPGSAAVVPTIAPNTPIPTPYQPGTLGAYVQGRSY